MAMLQADNGNYSPGIVTLMSCHLHLSRGILHAQSHSFVGTRQENRDVSGWDMQPKTQPLPGQRSRSIHHVPPRFSPNQVCSFKKSHIPNSVS